MALTVDDIAGHPGLHPAIRQQCRIMQQTFDGNPRLASVFGSQHRWLMGQIALALHFRGHVGEPPFAVISIKRERRASSCRIPWPCSSIHEKQVGSAVIVVVEERHASTHRFGQQLFTRSGVVMNKLDA